MSTLADLQRRNLAKMESSSAQNAEPPSPTETPSNEVSIIPSFTPLNEDMSDVSHDGAITPSNTQGVKASRTRSNKASSEANDPGLTGPGLKDALNAQLRAHLIEQLMPAGGKGPVTRLNVEMPEDLHQRLKQHCVRTRTPIKALINALIALYLEDEGEA